MEVKKGVLYGVSVGPGDPELLTLKALRVLQKCPVIAAPQTRSGETLALDIVRQADRLPDDVQRQRLAASGLRRGNNGTFTQDAERL